jgi:hypothetical protein
MVSEESQGPVAPKGFGLMANRGVSIQIAGPDRHVLQGWVDLANVKWDGREHRFSGVARVIGGEPFKIVIAGNGNIGSRATASGGPGNTQQAVSRRAGRNHPGAP